MMNAAETIQLTLISPSRKIEYEVVWIEVNTPNGNYLIQPQHAPTTFILAAYKPLTFCFLTGKQETFTPEKNGILQVTRKTATALI